MRNIGGAPFDAVYPELYEYEVAKGRFESRWTSRTVTPDQEHDWHKLISDLIDNARDRYQMRYQIPSQGTYWKPSQERRDFYESRQFGNYQATPTDVLSLNTGQIQTPEPPYEQTIVRRNPACTWIGAAGL